MVNLTQVDASIVKKINASKAKVCPIIIAAWQKV